MPSSSSRSLVTFLQRQCDKAARDLESAQKKLERVIATAAELKEQTTSARIKLEVLKEARDACIAAGVGDAGQRRDTEVSRVGRCGESARPRDSQEVLLNGRRLDSTAPRARYELHSSGIQFLMPSLNVERVPPVPDEANETPTWTMRIAKVLTADRGCTFTVDDLIGTQRSEQLSLEEIALKKAVVRTAVARMVKRGHVERVGRGNFRATHRIEEVASRISV
ncbi:hypothetical protein [Actinoplanes derwentensis]|nr:hypothetical protein [Actinoplanes derwentensis]